MPADKQTLFQWKLDLAHFPQDLTHFSDVLAIEHMHDTYKYNIIRKWRLEQAFQWSDSIVMIKWQQPKWP